MANSPLFPVLLSGGTGVRLWPVSREDEPKPFMKVADNQSLLQKTYLRAIALPDVQSVLTVTNREYFFRTHDEFEALRGSTPASRDIQNTFLLEPMGRNTAPAIALAALMLADLHGEDAIMLVLSADHLIENDAELLAAVTEAKKMANDGYLTTFGITPTRPETGYGYIKCGTTITNTSGFKVAKFVEKPSAELAHDYIASGEYYWNAGIFCFKAGKILSELQTYCPDVYAAAVKTWEHTKADAHNNKNTYNIHAETFASVPSISLDYAVMEKSNSVAIVPAKFKWSDIGSWESMCNFVSPDELNNRIDGKAILVDTKNTYVQSRSRTVAAVGIENLIIVDTDDAVLVAHRDKTQDVRKVVDHLRLAKNDIYKFHKTVTFQWGTCTILEESNDFKVKRIVVKPHAALPPQTLSDRSEHWTVVSGVAKITCDRETRLVQTNASLFLPAGETHRLENAGDTPLVIIEIQNNVNIETSGTANLREEKKNVV